MRQQIQSPPPNDFVKTVPFLREDVITTQFSRAPVDVDDTVPVALYTRPYERVEIGPDSKPYELIEIEPVEPEGIPLFLTISMLTCAFALGFGLGFLLQ